MNENKIVLKDQKKSVSIIDYKNDKRSIGIVNGISITGSERCSLVLDGLISKSEKQITVKAHKTKRGFVKQHKRKVKIVTEETKLNPLCEDAIISMTDGIDIGITGNLNEGNLFICKLKGGGAIYKVLDKEELFGEITYYKVDKLLNFDVCPETVEIDGEMGKGSLQKWISGGKDPLDIYDDQNDGIKLEEKHFDSLSKIFVHDLLCGNIDRSNRNVIIKDDKVYAIDNEIWGTDDYTQNELNSLNIKSGLGGDFGHSPMLSWVSDSINDEKSFLKLRECVKNNIKIILNNEKEILKLYKNMDDDIIKSNLSILKKYIGD